MGALPVEPSPRSADLKAAEHGLGSQQAKAPPGGALLHLAENSIRASHDLRPCAGLNDC